MLIDIIGMLIIGLLAGAVARFLVPGRDPMGCLMTSLLGIAGSFVGGYLYKIFFRTTEQGYVRPSFLVSVLGAVILVVLFRALRRR